MKDLVRVESNERVDITDFSYIAVDSIANSVNEILAKFVSNETSHNKAILEGFAISNPSGNQIKVTRGKAILGQRYAGTVINSILSTKGNTDITVDLSSYPNATYGIYIRFEQIAGNPDGRVFWNSAGTGSEYTQTIETRYVAGWSVRFETSNPGEEWLKIGEVVKPGMTITDERDFYFEGKVSSSYASGWSSEGGGSSTDRNTDRATYGTKDLYTFLASVRQCLEDIKGRGLRKWFSKGIGGMNIGFDSNPVEGALAIGDSDFYLKLIGNLATITMDSGANFKYSRSSKSFSWNSSSATQLTLTESALFGDITDSLGTSNAYWGSFYVKETNQYGDVITNCCVDDTSPSPSTINSDSINVQPASTIYTAGYSLANLSRKKEVYKNVTASPWTANRTELLEGFEAITNVNHISTPGATLSNSVKVRPGAAIIGGSTLLLDSVIGGNPITLNNLWDGDGSGGLTTQAKTYLTSTASGATNCLWLYVWLRSDGTFWLEPFGPEITNALPWKSTGGRFIPRTASGLPQSGFIATDYVLADVCWLVHGKAKTGTTTDIIAISGALHRENGYRAIEKALYDGSNIQPWFYENTNLSASTFNIDLQYVDAVNQYRRSPGMPSLISRKAKIAVIGNLNIADTASVSLYVGHKAISSTTVNADLPRIFYGSTKSGSFNILQTNNTGGTEDYPFSAIVDVETGLYYDSADDLYKSNIQIELVKSGTSTVTINMQLLGFYWDRKDTNLSTVSYTTV